ncbi:MFS transporter [Paenarthrobacter sp. NPDC091711]|uniref:MFS transporter n=1 Tax=Paenarthrobacter sp. NPDC091711 TaxID=3364385 RepID=UPI00380A613C
MTHEIKAKTPSDIQKSAIYRKISLRLMPVIIIAYFIAYIDRTNISIAKLQMSVDLGLSDAAFGLGAGLFFLGYFLFEVPSNLYMVKVGAKRTICRIMVLWGVISLLFVFVNSEWVFYILRFLLGAAEAGFFPGVILFLTQWYPAVRRARATGAFFVAIPLSGMLGSPLGGWIMQSMDGTLGLPGWHWLFIIESIPAIIMGIVVLFVLPDNPDDAKWLSAEEREIVKADLDHDLEVKSGHASGTIRSLFRNKWLALLTIIIFIQALGSYALSFWLPSLVAAAGVKGLLNIGLVSAIPFAVGVLGILLFTRSSDRLRERRWHLAIAFVTTAVGLIASILLTGQVVPSMIMLCVAAAGTYGVSAIVWNLPPMVLSGVGAAAGLAALNSIGSLAGFVAPSLLGYTTSFFGSADVGLVIISASVILGAILTLILPKRIFNPK